jgi:intron-binding protein aquarius
VALSRARLGLYILGRRDVFESCFELRQAFEILLRRPDQLMLVTGELWPSQRIIVEEEGKKSLPGETVMEGVEYLGQYVYEMTNAKVKQLRAERGLPENAELPPVAQEVEEDLMAFEEDEPEEPVVEGFEVEEE